MLNKISRKTYLFTRCFTRCFDIIGLSYRSYSAVDTMRLTNTRNILFHRVLRGDDGCSTNFNTSCVENGTVVAPRSSQVQHWKMEYVRSIGIVPDAGENAVIALRRHAEANRWRGATIRRHMRLLQESAGDSVEEALDDLDQMNGFLRSLGRLPQPSKTQAQRILSQIYVNIWDFEAHISVWGFDGQAYDSEFETLRDLRRYTKRNRLFFPKNEAKTTGYNVFLRNCFRCEANRWNLGHVLLSTIFKFVFHSR